MQTSIKEYIGMRYAPLFYDDGNGGAEWNQNDTYEPLTIVQYQGNSFTSRQYVPAGISINNTTYWLETGNWNSQVEQYRREVFTFDERIDAAQDQADAAYTRAGTAITNAATADGKAVTAKNRADEAYTLAQTAKTTADGAVSVNTTQNNRIAALEAGGNIKNIVAISDSWGDGWNGTTSINSWIYYMKQNLASGTTVYESHEGGAGFAATGQSGHNFTALLQNLANNQTTEVKNKVSIVIAGGGVNDANSSESNIKNGILSFCNAVRSAYPNAKILVAGISCMGKIQAADVWKMTKVAGAYMLGANRAGGCYVLNSEFAAVGSPWASDGNHLTDYSDVGYYMAGALTSGSIDVYKSGSATITPALTDSSVTYGDNPNVLVHNNMAELVIDDTRISFTTEKPTFGWDRWTVIGNWTCTLQLKRGYGFQFNANCLVNIVNSGWTWVPCIVSFWNDGTIQVKVAAPTGTGTFQASNINIISGWQYTNTLLA